MSKKLIVTVELGVSSYNAPFKVIDKTNVATVLSDKSFSRGVDELLKELALERDQDFKYKHDYWVDKTDSNPELSVRLTITNITAI